MAAEEASGNTGGYARLPYLLEFTSSEEDEARVVKAAGMTKKEASDLLRGMRRRPSEGGGGQEGRGSRLAGKLEDQGSGNDESDDGDNPKKPAARISKGNSHGGDDDPGSEEDGSDDDNSQKKPAACKMGANEKKKFAAIDGNKKPTAKKTGNKKGPGHGRRDSTDNKKRRASLPRKSAEKAKKRREGQNLMKAQLSVKILKGQGKHYRWKLDDTKWMLNQSTDLLHEIAGTDEIWDDIRDRLCAKFRVGFIGRDASGTGEGASW